MLLFAVASVLVIGAALVLEATSEEGVLEVRPEVWFAILTVLGAWLLVLAS